MFCAICVPPRATQPSPNFHPLWEWYLSSWRAPWTRSDGPCSHPGAGTSSRRGHRCAPRTSRARRACTGWWTAGHRSGTAQRTACWGRAARRRGSSCPSSIWWGVPARRNQRPERNCSLRYQQSKAGSKRRSHQSRLEILKILFVCGVMMILRLFPWGKAKYESLIRVSKCSHHFQWIINKLEEKLDKFLEEIYCCWHSSGPRCL